jgi:hypothetical protein
VVESIGSLTLATRVPAMLSAIFYSTLSFTHHVSSVCKSAHYYMRDLRRIRRSINKSTAISLANALVSSRLDYCNSLFFSLTKKELGRLQSIQNTLCRIVCRLPKWSGTKPASISKALRFLHWLPIKSRILFKLHIITYKTFNTGIPIYLREHIVPYTTSRKTRRSDPAQKISVSNKL